MPEVKRFDKLLCAAPAALLGCAALLMEWRATYHDASYLKIPGLICAGIAALPIISAEFAKGRLFQLQRTLAILIINTVIVFGLAEVVCRIARVDFNIVLGLKGKNEGFPIFFRLPDQPVGSVFFVRDGPASWTGKPLSVMLKNHRGTDAAYQDEKEITITYDRNGFRNPEGLKDWEIAIAGDSFTESGYIPYEELYTTLLSGALNKRVKNLGVSDTGNLTQSYYLRSFGKAPSCRTAILAFFEGNDLDDNVEEMRDLEKLRTTGERPCREIGRESSLLKTLYHFVRDFKRMNLHSRSYANATFVANGNEIPVTIADAPPAPEKLSAEQKTALNLGLESWARSCKDIGAEAWLLYIPCKRRVLDGHLIQGKDYPDPGWKLNNLPEYISQNAGALGIRFLDTTPALTELAAKGVLTYNPIYDTHLNKEGHQAVAEVLASALKGDAVFKTFHQFLEVAPA